MSKFQINTKSSNYTKDKEAFLKELKQFNDSKSIPYKVPVVNGVLVDLYLFYTLVQQRGGISKVNQTDAWDSFLRPLRLPHPCINGSTLLRKIYATYLEKYERAKGPPGRDDDNDMEEDFRLRTRGGGSGAMPRVTFSGAYITEPARSGPRHGGPSERLALSLLSPMPNEQDFAVNVCTVLAADHSNRLPLSSTPHILDFLLAHAGVYNHSSLRETIGRSYYEVRGSYPDEFWRKKAGGGGARELADETQFTAPGLEHPELIVQALAAENTLKDCLTLEGNMEEYLDKILYQPDSEEWVTDPSDDEDLFAQDLPGGAKCVYTQRVLQVASIVRSLSFHEENVQILAKNTTLIRFLLLCANSWVGTLRQSGLDTLGNVCTELVIKEPATCLITRHILSTIQSSLESPDRARVLAALELLNKLAQNENNEDVLLKNLEPKMYSEVCSFLSLRDIMLLVSSLECVYALTGLGERAAETVAKVPGAINTLVSLVTVEAQSYGPRACILMRVVETVCGPSVPQQAEEQPQPAATTQAQTQPQVTPTKTEARPQSTTNATSSPLTIQQSHLQQQQILENEQFALAWLRASFEPLPVNNNAGVDAGEVYRQYLALCSKLNRKGLIAPAHFPRLVRTIFGGTVGPNNVTISTGETQQMYIGIKSRNTPNSRTTQAPAGPSSPILKAQLTNKTGISDNKQTANTSQVTSQHNAALSQALETSNPNSTTLIKHLLANKVSPVAHAGMQVAQRQQNQQRVIQQPTVVAQQGGNVMELDPEALIKCSTITPGGVASSTPMQDKVVSVIPTTVEEAIKDEMQFQLDEQTQLTIKSAQNKMLADLLEKKSNPPVQVVQVNQQINPPTIQITESGQIVQVKPESVVQFNEAGQFIQIKNEPFSSQVIVKTEIEDEDPANKKIKLEEKREKSPQESVSKTAANLYAALAASALEDEEDLIQQTSVQIQQPTLQVQTPTLQVQQPMLQVQPMDVQMQNILTSQGGQLILQEKQMGTPQTQFVQQPMQIITAPNTSQAGLNYIAQNLQGMQQHKTIIIVQGPTGGGPITLTVNNTAGLDECTLNSVITQATEAITQQQIIQNTPQLTASQQPIISSQPQPHKAQIVNQQQIMVAQKSQPTIITSNGNQQILTSGQQLIAGGQQIITGGPQIITGGPQIITTGQQMLSGGQQIITSGQLVAVSGSQQILVNTPIKQNMRMMQQANTKVVTSQDKPSVIQSTSAVKQPAMRQVVTRQPIMVGSTKIGDKEVIVQQPIETSPPQTKKPTTPKQPSTSPQNTISPDDNPWICHWRGCGKSFESATAVFSHCARMHVPGSSTGEAVCLWAECDRVPRKTFALLNHLHDRHCTPDALKALFLTRRRSSSEGEGSKPVSLGYPPNAAMAALNKHAVDFLNPRELMHRADNNRTTDHADENEGPVTKSIRLTAALILRNIVIYSNTGRRHLRSYEAHLATIALSSVEASRTISQVLYDMNNI